MKQAVNPLILELFERKLRTHDIRRLRGPILSALVAAYGLKQPEPATEWKAKLAVHCCLEKQGVDMAKMSYGADVAPSGAVHVSLVLRDAEEHILSSAYFLIEADVVTCTRRPQDAAAS